jgi:hypothetical protein
VIKFSPTLHVIKETNIPVHIPLAKKKTINTYVATDHVVDLVDDNLWPQKFKFILRPLHVGFLV